MTESFDTQKVLDSWDVVKEQQKSEFLEHMYQCSGREEKTHPMHRLFTGLWQEFCIKEAGPFARNHYFEFKTAVDKYEKMKADTIV